MGRVAAVTRWVNPLGATSSVTLERYMRHETVNRRIGSNADSRHLPDEDVSMTRFDSPDAVEAAFYAAFASMDLSAMGDLWAETPRPVCVHPGGDLLEGRTAVLRSWTEILTGAERPDLRFRVIQRTWRDDLAVHLTEEQIRPANSRASHTRILATNVFQRTPEGWRLTAPAARDTSVVSQPPHIH
jgi:ketosteroid isomerase-like protein